MNIVHTFSVRFDDEYCSEFEALQDRCYGDECNSDINEESSDETEPT